jgi:hypothetical protein
VPCPGLVIWMDSIRSKNGKVHVLNWADVQENRGIGRHSDNRDVTERFVRKIIKYIRIEEKKYHSHISVPCSGAMFKWFGKASEPKAVQIPGIQADVERERHELKEMEIWFNDLLRRNEKSPSQLYRSLVGVYNQFSAVKNEYLRKINLLEKSRAFWGSPFVSELTPAERRIEIAGIAAKMYNACETRREPLLKKWKNRPLTARAIATVAGRRIKKLKR